VPSDLHARRLNQVQLVGVPSPANPRTGMDVPFDVLKAIQNRASEVFLGA
jgi:hypothetical protein